MKFYPDSLSRILGDVWSWFKIESKKTLLTRACEKGHTRWAKFLLNVGFNVNKLDGNGKTPLWAVLFSESINEDKKVEMVELLQRYNVNLESESQKDLCKPLEFVIEKGYAKLAKTLINSGSKIEFSYSYGENILCRVVNSNLLSAKDKLELINVLKENDLDLNFVDNEGKTVLWTIVDGQQSDEEKKMIISKLVEVGVDINKRDNRGYSLLTYTIENKKDFMKDVLIECGANTDIVTTDRIFVKSWNYLMSYLLKPEVQKKLIRVAVAFLRDGVRKSDSLGEDEKKWIDTPLSIIDRIAKDIDAIVKFTNALIKEYDEITSVMKRAKKAYQLIEKDVKNITIKVLNNVEGERGISDVAVRVTAKSLDKFLKNINKDLKNVNTIKILNSLLKETLENIDSESKRDLLKKNASCVANEVTSELEDRMKGCKNKIVNVVADISKSMFTSTTKRLADENIIKLKKNVKKINSSTMKNYSNNKIRDIRKFFATPAKKDKWKNTAINNIKFVLNDQKSLRRVKKDRKLFTQIRLFIQDNNKDGKFSEEIRRINKSIAKGKEKA
ncbi:MAG: ankyrin repeat domain-containing protein [Clostridiales bacterium]|nr:ankyrin repeat domain-containing protein [Clostridiales bacterium]